MIANFHPCIQKIIKLSENKYFCPFCSQERDINQTFCICPADFKLYRYYTAQEVYAYCISYRVGGYLIYQNYDDGGEGQSLHINHLYFRVKNMDYILTADEVETYLLFS